jgi:DNA modification methylase
MILKKVFDDLARLRSVLGKHEFVEEVTNFLKTNTKQYTEKSQRQGLTAPKKAKSQKREMGVINSFVNGMKTQSIIRQSSDSHYNSIHPTQKPVRLLEILIELVTSKGDIILDSFMGSGSTALASINTDREYIGYEIDEEYYEGAQERIENHQEQLTLV